MQLSAYIRSVAAFALLPALQSIRLHFQPYDSTAVPHQPAERTATGCVIHVVYAGGVYIGVRLCECECVLVW